MVWMLVIADDFTGALDTGIQFAKRGIRTMVEAQGWLEHGEETGNPEVLVLNLETRHLSPDKAYKRVEKAMSWACDKKIKIIYKKTDSVLRGNVGSELAAVLSMSERKRLYFIPAFPKMNRYTVNGIQYLKDVPLAESKLGRDAFEPVRYSYIPELIRQQSSCNTITIKTGVAIEEKVLRNEKKTICVCDASSDMDIWLRIQELQELGELNVLAGCAGFAEYLAKYLADFLGKKERRKELGREVRNMLISCGSLNEVTRKQIDYLESKNYKRIHLSNEQKTIREYYQSEEGRQFIEELKHIIKREGVVALDTFGVENNQEFLPEARFDIARCHGIIAKKLVEEHCIDTVFIMGGDTLMGFMEEMECTGINPVCELEGGVVLSELYHGGNMLQVISKSGGFGEQKLLYEIVEKLKENGRKGD